MMNITQCERIVRYMNEFGCITPLDALSDLGVMRLASRRSDLRKSGVPIKKEMVSAKNRYGETVHFAKYQIVEAEG